MVNFYYNYVVFSNLDVDERIRVQNDKLFIGYDVDH